MMSLSDDKQADDIDAFNTTSRYLDDILNINNVYFDYLSIYLRILPYALADILGSCALSSNVSRKRKRIKA